MKKSILYIFCFILIALFTNCKQKESTGLDQNKTYTGIDSLQEMIARGEYLVKIIGCNDCHTPKKMTAQGPIPDLYKQLMGYPGGDPLPEINKLEIEPGKWILFNGDLTAAVGPWGVSFAANLTPHETGLGNWTFENFKRAMTEGRFKGLENSRQLLPPMPWMSFKEMNEEDLKAIFEYLKTIKPINNIVPEYIPPTKLN